MEPIYTHEQYESVKATIEQLMASDPPPGSADGAQLVALAELAEAYERKRWPLPDDYERRRERKRFETLELFLTIGSGVLLGFLVYWAAVWIF